MKKILALIGSPRPFGNCEILVKEISKNIAEEHELSLLRLTDFNIEYCNGCYKCLFDKMACSKDDDLTIIINSLVECNALIAVFPTYFFKAHSSLHRLLDRGLAFYGYADKIWNKPALGIGICGINEKEGSTLLDIEKLLKVLHCNVKETTILNGRLPGDIFLNKDNLRRAHELAASLFTFPKEKPVKCPLCGSDTFRFISHNEIKCMLCSNKGTISYKDNKPEINIFLTGKGIYLNKEQSMEHLEWLRDMKNDYLKKRKKLREIKSDYLGNYRWIKP